MDAVAVRDLREGQQVLLRKAGRRNLEVVWVIRVMADKGQVMVWDQQKRTRTVMAAAVEKLAQKPAQKRVKEVGDGNGDD